MDLDDSLFSFDVPKGYTLTVVDANKVTEQERIDFLGLVAEYSGNIFPDRMSQFDLNRVDANLHIRAKYDT